MCFCQFFLNLRRSILLETETEGLNHERHVQSELTHCLHTLFVADDLAWSCTVGYAPVLRGHDGHVRLQEILVQYVNRCCGATTAGDALLLQRTLHFMQRRCRIAVLGLFINYPKSRYKYSEFSRILCKFAI